MIEKTCSKCNRELPLDCFYKTSGMSGSYFSRCKECTKEDVRKNRLKNIDYYRSYDRIRGNRLSSQYVREYRKKYPNKYKATNMVNNAIRDNRLFNEDCEICGIKPTHAHHDDYLKPLNVRWLCPAHHRQWHVKNGDGLNP